MDKIQAWRNSAEYKKTREIGNKFAKFRAFTVAGLPQLLAQLRCSIRYTI